MPLYYLRAPLCRACSLRCAARGTALAWERSRRPSGPPTAAALTPPAPRAPPPPRQAIALAFAPWLIPARLPPPARSPGGWALGPGRRPLPARHWGRRTPRPLLFARASVPRLFAEAIALAFSLPPARGGQVLLPWRRTHARAAAVSAPLGCVLPDARRTCTLGSGCLHTPPFPHLTCKAGTAQPSRSKPCIVPVHRDAPAHHGRARALTAKVAARVGSGTCAAPGAARLHFAHIR